MWELHGCRLHEVGATVTAYRASALVGCAFPAVVAEPDGWWFVRIRGQRASRARSRYEALRVLVGCAGSGCGECSP